MADLLKSLLIGGAEIAAGVILAPVGGAGGMYAGMELFAGASALSARLVQDRNGLLFWSFSDPDEPCGAAVGELTRDA